MVHSATLLFGALALFSNVVHASFDARSACNVDTYGPFKLYSVSNGPDGTSLIKVKLGVDDNNNTISTLTTCETCGQTPTHWTLKNSVLSPFFNVTAPTSVETINLDLPFGKVDVITGPKRNLTPASIYCVKLGETPPLTVLSANGHENKFSVCSWIGGVGPAHRRDIYYNQTSTLVASNCQNTTLVIKHF